MHDKLCLFKLVGKASLIVAMGCFALVLGAKVAVTPGEQQVLGAIIAFLPGGIAAWWMFRKLRAHYTRRQSRAAAITFAVFTPVALLIGVLVAQIPGGYAEVLGRPFGLVGAFVGIVVTITLLNFVPTVLALWISRRTEGDSSNR